MAEFGSVLHSFMDYFDYPTILICARWRNRNILILSGIKFERDAAGILNILINLNLTIQ